MRILVLTNYYPPAECGGGYMQLCEEVANGLSAKGHAVAVLTSTCGAGQDAALLKAGANGPQAIYRRLSIDPDWRSAKPGAWQFFFGRRRRERQAIGDLHHAVAGFAPDLIFVWHILGLPRLLLHEAEQLPGLKVAYYLADTVLESPDEYLDYWHKPSVRRSTGWLKRPLARLALAMLAHEGKPISLQIEHAVCVSDYLRRRLVSQGLLSTDAVAIYNGVDLAQFDSGRHEARSLSSGALKCVVAGRVVPDKGIHTVIEAWGLLRDRAELGGTTLTILGNGPAGYIEFLRERVDHHQLQDAVEFCPPVPRAKMPDVLAGFDVLILPSEYPEPLARAAQEAMAMDLLVIGTTTGGSGELLVHERTGLAFEASNPESLAQQLARAESDRQLATTIAQNGRQAVVQNFDIRRTIHQVEDYLLHLVNAESPG